MTLARPSRETRPVHRHVGTLLGLERELQGRWQTQNFSIRVGDAWRDQHGSVVLERDQGFVEQSVDGRHQREAVVGVKALAGVRIAPALNVRRAQSLTHPATGNRAALLPARENSLPETALPATGLDQSLPRRSA